MPVRALALSLAVFGLAACVAEAPRDAPASQPAPSQPAPPAVGFSADVSDAAVDSCRRALDALTDGAVEVTGSEFSEANSAVYMVVGANRAPWRCLVSNDGAGPELMFLGDDGAL